MQPFQGNAILAGVGHVSVLFRIRADATEAREREVMSNDAQGSRSDLYIAIHLKPDDLKDWTPMEVYEFFRGMGASEWITISFRPFLIHQPPNEAEEAGR